MVSRIFNRRILSVAVAVLIVLSGVVIYVVTLGQAPHKESDTNNQDVAPLVTKETAVVVQRAQDAASRGDVDSAIEQYDYTLGKDINNHDKSELLRGKAAVYFNAGRYTEALSAALEADSLWSTRFTAGLVGDIYVRLQDKDNAVKYYQLAIERIKTDGYGDLPFNDDAHYQERIEIAHNS